MKKLNAIKEWFQKFTLIELMIVIAIISIVLAVLIPIFDDPCSDYVVENCYIKKDDNPFIDNKNKICVKEIKEEYIRYDEHVGNNIIKNKSEKCYFLYHSGYNKKEIK